MTAIYLHDARGILSGPVDLPVIPGLGVQMPSNGVAQPEPLPAADHGHVWVLLDGTVQQYPYFSGTAYSTLTGAAQAHEGLGDLPDGLTHEPRPSEFHYWQEGAWVLDEVAKADAEREAAMAANPRPSEFHHWQGDGWVLDEAEQQAAALSSERMWRDERLEEIVWMRDRHRDQIELEMVTTQSAEQYVELLRYIQNLRDWPQAEVFPGIDKRPVSPNWLV